MCPPIDSPSSSFDDAWSSFQSLEELRLTGDPVEMSRTRGRARYLAFLIRIEDIQAREHLAAIAQRLAHIPGVEPFPEHYWHITVKGAGFQVIKRVHADDILRTDVPSIVSAAREALATEEAFDTRLGLVNGFPDAIFVEIHDAGRTHHLNERLADGLPDLHRSAFDGERFLPHVSIARFTSNDGLPELKALLAEMRSEGIGPRVPVRRVEFIQTWLIPDEVAEFDTIATFPLLPEARSS